MRDLGRRMVLGVALAGTLAGCSGDPLAPFDPEVDNDTDSFQLQATQVRNVSTILDYTWRNTGTVANVDHSTTTAAGLARLRVWSADGQRVYERALAPSLNEQTGTGEPGDWTIEVVLSDYSGTLNFRLQKP